MKEIARKEMDLNSRKVWTLSASLKKKWVNLNQRNKMHRKD